MTARRHPVTSRRRSGLPWGKIALAGGVLLGFGLTAVASGTAHAEVPGPEGADHPAEAEAQYQVGQPAPEPPAPEPTEPTPQQPAILPGSYRRWRVTTYHIAKLVPGNEVELLDTEGQLLGWFTRKSKAELDMEGSGQLPDGRYINWTGQGKPYRVLLPGVGGTGTHGTPLVPFKSVAVDQGDPRGKHPQPWKDSVTRNGPLVPFGTRIYIKEFDGRTMPDGSTHDGWVVAQDTGPAIYGAHLDFFLGLYPDGSLKHPTICHIWFDGIEAIPTDYDYGLVRVYPGYDKLRPPQRGAGESA